MGRTRSRSFSNRWSSSTMDSPKETAAPPPIPAAFALKDTFGKETVLFDTCFWGAYSSGQDSADADSDAAVCAGVRSLFAASGAHLKELAALIATVRARIDAEKLSDRAVRAVCSSTAASGVTTASPPASAALQLSTWASALRDTAAAHAAHAEALRDSVLNVLVDFRTKQKRILQTRKNDVEETLILLSKARGDVEAKLRETRDIKSRDVAALVSRAEHARAALEFKITQFLVFAHEFQSMRMRILRDACSGIEAAQRTFLLTVAKIYGSTADNSNLERDFGSFKIFEVPDPVAGIADIAHRLQTGTARIPSIVISTTEPTQAFGIDLDVLAAAQDNESGDCVPAFLRKCIASLNEGLIVKRIGCGIEAWMPPAVASERLNSLPAVQFLRMEANSSVAGSMIHYSRLQKESPSTIASVIKQFLLELPSPLVPVEAYDALKLIYDSSQKSEKQDATNEDIEQEIRLRTVCNLLTTLSDPHYETLNLLAGLWQRTIESSPTPLSESRIQWFAKQLAPCVLRPSQETLATLQSDTHSVLFVQDLLTNHSRLFSALPPTTAYMPPRTPSPEVFLGQSNGLFSKQPYSDDFPETVLRSPSRQSRPDSRAASVLGEVASSFGWFMRSIAGGDEESDGVNGALAAFTRGNLAGSLSTAPTTRRSFPVGGLSTVPVTSTAMYFQQQPQNGRTFQARTSYDDDWGDDDDGFASREGGSVRCFWDGCGLELSGGSALRAHVEQVHLSTYTDDIDEHRLSL
ncbi:hypothetical protein HDU83_007537 [Entophlyctis luteolus]|nr:hypothetical protein HDU83_007537 [Entophlyctis luteolus]KAJ3386816.1 hypothetical protein HDU84_001263 [Entophlyctis sp. JEL0112]